MSDLNVPLTVREVRASFPCWVKVVQLKTYSPAAGAVNIPVEESYPFPSFKYTIPNTTRPFDARLLTCANNRT